MEAIAHSLYDRSFEPLAIRQVLASKFNFFGYEPMPQSLSCAAATRINGVRFGSIGVLKHVGFGPRRGLRGISHIRADHVDDFLLVLPVQGGTAISQPGATIEVGPGQFTLMATAKPFDIAIAPDTDRSYRQYLVKVPGPLLRTRAPDIDDDCLRAFSTQSGVGAILKSLIWISMRQGQRLSESQSLRFGEMLVDGIANTMSEAPHSIGKRSRCLSSHLRICEVAEHYIESHLSDPDLDPARIARSCNVSVGYLHAAFASKATTVNTFIREARLLHCRVALRSPELQQHSVFQIALRWGFNDPAYFSRAYKARFGRSPSKDRGPA